MSASMTSIATDDLEWKRSGCSYDEIEMRSKTDGMDGERPTSKCPA